MLVATAPACCYLAILELAWEMEAAVALGDVMGHRPEDKTGPTTHTSVPGLVVHSRIVAEPRSANAFAVVHCAGIAGSVVAAGELNNNGN